jgi:hypothetical protein
MPCPAACYLWVAYPLATDRAAIMTRLHLLPTSGERLPPPCQPTTVSPQSILNVLGPTPSFHVMSGGSITVGRAGWLGGGEGVKSAFRSGTWKPPGGGEGA